MDTPEKIQYIRRQMVQAQNNRALLLVLGEGLARIQEILQHLRGLAEQATGYSLEVAERQELQRQVEYLLEQIDRVANSVQLKADQLQVQQGEEKMPLN